MLQTSRLGVFAGFLCLALFNGGAFADDHAYSEGAVVSVSSIRTSDGKFDDYMKFVEGCRRHADMVGENPEAGADRMFRPIGLTAVRWADQPMFLVNVPHA